MARLQADPSFLDSRSTLEVVLILGLVAIAAVAVAVLAFRLRSRWLLAATLVLGVVQFFGPFGFTSVALLVTCALFPAAVWRSRRVLLGVRTGSTLWVWLLLALAVWQAIAVLWSEKLGSAAYPVIFAGAALTVFLLARDVIAHDADGLPWAIAVVAPLILVSALAVVAFRLFPGLEAHYLLSHTATLFTEPDVVRITEDEVLLAGDPVGQQGLFYDITVRPGAAGGMFAEILATTDPTGFQNVLAPDKSGGFFLNGNTAALFFAITACVAAWAALSARRRALHLVTLVASLVAVVATGSKTALALLIALPVAALFIAFWVRRPRLGTIIAAVIAVGVAAAVAVVARVAPGAFHEGTLGDRLVLWRVVADAFPGRWFEGFGFGHWRNHIVAVWGHYFPDVATQTWPPHNLFLQAWVDAGIVALLLTIALVAVPLVASVLRIAEARRGALLAAPTLRAGIVFVGLAWVLLHGLADTTTFLGDNHTAPFVAVLTALALMPTRTDQPRATEGSA
ncbi:O-antigen ligase [Microbacterium sp. G2-8]|uniref:O-antigen ligase family protein n=1 Tax=Microbacterium sp. G2-8 TaxID=2842454 RepID=UPI001C89F889|nr:O-antigen ligase family protein [Microbacterium sp. G2-8]